MKKIDIATYNDIYRPKLNRRQRIAMDAFTALNREREYISTSVGAIPLNIKKREIKLYWQELIMPISFTYFLTYLQAMDDVFVEHSKEQARAALDG